MNKPIKRVYVPPAAISLREETTHLQCDCSDGGGAAASCGVGFGVFGVECCETGTGAGACLSGSGLQAG